MAFPKISAFDAKNFAARLYERVTKPNGDRYSVFAEDQFPPFVQSVRAVRDAASATDALTKELDTRIDHCEERLAALEVAPPPAHPFP